VVDDAAIRSVTLDPLMNPAKLLASRNILLGVAIVGILLVSFVMLQTRTGSSETMPSADRIGAPPEASADVVPLDTALAAVQGSRTPAARRYRQATFSGHVDEVMLLGKNGWAAAITLNGGRATAYIAESRWRSIAPAIAKGQTRAFTCADWESGVAGTSTMYGCAVVPAP
jgi:hypothetical protein